jgi:alpha/beta superfamily hydrolase
LPLYLAGFSFGGAVALAAAGEARPNGLVTVAPPVDKLPADFTAPRCPWLLVHGGADDVVPVSPTQSWVATLASPPRLVVLDGVGHFFHGRLAELEEAVTGFFAADFASLGTVR